jgi:hypothetical protein
VRTLLALASVLALAGSAAAVDVTACGQSVPDFDTGVLQADLDCSGEPGVCIHLLGDDTEMSCTSDTDCPQSFNACARAAVQLGAGASLQLNGHSLTGAGVLCSDSGTCTVTGPGSIVSAPVGILARKKVIASGLTATGGKYGIISRRGGAILTDVVLTNNTEDGIWSWRGTIRATGVVATGNGDSGLYATLKPVIARDSTSSNNGNHGIDGYPPRAVGVTVEGNGGGGLVSAKGLSVVGSTVTGNGIAYGGLDVWSARRPRVIDTVCDHSRNSGPDGGGSWGVCASD